MTGSILDLAWPPNIQPLKLPDFETQARRLRYQALGTACRAHRLPHLLVAHHSDDVAEIVLMRLASSQKGVGLKGIPESIDVPECWGMYGVHRSGHAFTKSNERSFVDEGGQSEQQNLSSSSVFESGGIKILRPLLKFRKQDLMATCIAHGVTWVEDQTNKDVWRTPRNAARNLLCNSQLPVALRRESLLQLSSYMTSKERRHSGQASQLLSQCQILLFDLRSGRILVRLPKYVAMDKMISDADDWHGLSQTLLHSLLVRGLAMAVTPDEHIPLHSLQTTSGVMFAETQLPVKAGLIRNGHCSKFTVAGVQFERVPLPFHNKTSVANPDANIERDQLQQSYGLQQKHIWSLTRQPHRNTCAENQSLKYEISPSASFHEDSASVSQLWSSWCLWDGRYWVRVMNGTAHVLQVRPFCARDLEVIRKTLSKPVIKALDQALASAAPGKARWTLPVISEVPKAKLTPGKVFALPSLGKPGILDVEDECGRKKVGWEIRYKSVDLVNNRDSDSNLGKTFVTPWEDS